MRMQVGNGIAANAAAPSSDEEGSDEAERFSFSIATIGHEKRDSRLVSHGITTWYGYGLCL